MTTTAEAIPFQTRRHRCNRRPYPAVVVLRGSRNEINLDLTGPQLRVMNYCVSNFACGFAKFPDFTGPSAGRTIKLLMPNC